MLCARKPASEKHMAAFLWTRCAQRGSCSRAVVCICSAPSLAARVRAGACVFCQCRRPWIGFVLFPLHYGGFFRFWVECIKGACYRGRSGMVLHCSNCSLSFLPFCCQCTLLKSLVMLNQVSFVPCLLTAHCQVGSGEVLGHALVGRKGCISLPLPRRVLPLHSASGSWLSS